MNKAIIATHNGVFHADDVFAVATLNLYFFDTEVVRTRDNAIIEAADWVVDVGGVYNSSDDRFDHHQKGFKNSRPDGCKYSSFGLVWDKFGDEMCGSPEAAKIVDDQLVRVVDAVDNGQDEFINGNFGYSDVISGFNPTWNEVADHDLRFNEAVEFATTILQNAIRSAKGAVGAKEEVCNGSTIYEGRVVVLERFCPWQDFVITCMPNALFVLFPDVTGDWRIQVVPEESGGFKARKDLPATWAGLRAEDLAAVTGCDDAIFCHNGRFIAGASSKTSVARMAMLALAD